MPSSLYGDDLTQQIGTTHDNDCGVFPAHLHQGYASTNWVRNGFYPTRADCDNDYGCITYGSVWDNYQHYRTWYASGY